MPLRRRAQVFWPQDAEPDVLGRLCKSCMFLTLIGGGQHNPIRVSK